MAAIPLQREVHYPESDGKPMAESDLHREVMTDLIHGLKTRYAGEPNVYVAGNLLLYYVEGDPRKSVSPDVLVTWGIRKGRRKTYLLWKEGRAPGFVIEVTSDSTRGEDLGKKKDLYQQLGVEEYILFDPLGDYLHPRLQGYRLALGGRYQHIPLEADGSLLSRTTGLRLRIEGESLRLIDEATGERLLFVEEETAARLAAEEEAEAARERAEQESRARRALEEEIERLRKELGRS